MGRLFARKSKKKTSVLNPDQQQFNEDKSKIGEASGTPQDAAFHTGDYATARIATGNIGNCNDVIDDSATDLHTTFEEKVPNMDDETLQLLHGVGNKCCLPKLRILHSLRSSNQPQKLQKRRQLKRQSSSSCLSSDLVDGTGIGLTRSSIVVNNEYEMELLLNNKSHQHTKYVPSYSLTKQSGIQSKFREKDERAEEDEANSEHKAEEECLIVSFIDPSSLLIKTSPTTLNSATTPTTTSIAYNQYEWFPSAICLSTLQNDRYFDDSQDTTLLKTTKSTFIKYFVPVPLCIVQNSCLRHMKGYVHAVGVSSNNCNEHSKSTAPTKSALKHTRMDSNDNIKNKDMSSMILHDPDAARDLIIDFVKNDNFNGAMIVTKNLLHHYQSNSKLQKQIQRSQNKIATAAVFGETLSLVSLFGQMVLFCLAMGRNGEALRYSSEAIEIMKSLQQQQRHCHHQEYSPNKQHRYSKQLVDTLLRHALVLFSTNKVSQAKKALREALQIAIAKNGCTDLMVSVLLCNIGVIHLECGRNVKSSIVSFEESLVAQKSLLKDRVDVCHNDYTPNAAMYRLAITMSNLAIAYERVGEIACAITLLEESISIFGSIDLSNNDLKIAEKHLLRLAAQKQDEEKMLDVHVFNSSIELENRLNLSSSCQMLFVNDGELDKFINLSHPFDGDDDTYTYDSETNVDDSDMDGYESERSMVLFGNGDGVPICRVYPRILLEESDNHDFLLLGPLVPELSMEQRVYETIKVWIGKQNTLTEDMAITENAMSSSLPPKVATIDGSQGKRIGGGLFCKKDLKYNLNFNGDTVLDADLYLNEIHKQVMIFLDENRIDDAIAILNGAVQSHRKKYGEKHHLVGSAYHNMGMVLFFAQRYSDALTMFENAILIRNESLSSYHPDMHNSLLKIALLHIAMGKIHEAYDMLMDLRDTLSRSISNVNSNSGGGGGGDGSGKVYDLIQLAKVSNNLGVLAYEFGDVLNALESFKTAYNHQREVYQQYKMMGISNSTYDTGSWKILKLLRLNTLCNMAFIYVKMGDKERGLELYDKAYSIMVAGFVVPMYHPIVQCTVSNIDVLVEAIYHNNVRLDEASDDVIIKGVLKDTYIKGDNSQGDFPGPISRERNNKVGSKTIV